MFDIVYAKERFCNEDISTTRFILQERVLDDELAKKKTQVKLLVVLHTGKINFEIDL